MTPPGASPVIGRIHAEQFPCWRIHAETSSVSPSYILNPIFRGDLRGCPSYFCRDRGVPPLFSQRYVTQRELMRLFEGNIKTDILNSTYCSISKKHFDTKIIFISHSYQKLQIIQSQTLWSLWKWITKIWAGKVIDLYTNLLKILRTVRLKHNFLSRID